MCDTLQRVSSIGDTRRGLHTQALYIDDCAREGMRGRSRIVCAIVLCMRVLERENLQTLLLLHWSIVDRSVTKARSRLGLTEHAAGLMLGSLRSAFNDDLLVSSGGDSLAPTRLATSVSRRLKTVFTHLQEVGRLQSKFDPKAFSKNVGIAGNDYLAAIGADVWTSSIAASAPKAAVNWRPLDASAATALGTGEVDFVLFVLAPYATQPNMPDTAAIREMAIEPLIADQFVAFGRKEHSLFHLPRISAEQYAAVDHILVSPSGSGPGVVDLELSKLGLSRRVHSRSWSFLLAADMALRTNSIATIPKCLARRFPGGVFRNVPLKLPALPSFIGWHVSQNTSPAHTWLRRKFVAELQMRAWMPTVYRPGGKSLAQRPKTELV